MDFNGSLDWTFDAIAVTMKEFWNSRSLFPER